MDGKEELKQIYDIFTGCWRLYKKLYPPSRPEDDAYWQGMMKELEVLRKNHHHSRLCEDLLCAVVRNLETKSKRNGQNDISNGRSYDFLWWVYIRKGM